MVRKTRHVIPYPMRFGRIKRPMKGSKMIYFTEDRKMSPRRQEDEEDGKDDDVPAKRRKIQEVRGQTRRMLGQLFEEDDARDVGRLGRIPQIPCACHPHGPAGLVSGAGHRCRVSTGR